MNSNEITTVQMGEYVTQIAKYKNKIFAKLSPIMKYLGYYNGGGGQYAKRLGTENCKKFKVGKVDSWFINLEGYEELLKMTKLNVSSQTTNTIFQDVYGVKDSKDTTIPYTYFFTKRDIINIYEEISKKPINKCEVINLLSKGKK